MELQKEKPMKAKSKPQESELEDITTTIPTAPTLEDFHVDIKVNDVPNVNKEIVEDHVTDINEEPKVNKDGVKSNLMGHGDDEVNDKPNLDMDDIKFSPEDHRKVLHRTEEDLPSMQYEPEQESTLSDQSIKEANSPNHSNKHETKEPYLRVRQDLENLIIEESTVQVPVPSAPLLETDFVSDNVVLYEDHYADTHEEEHEERISEEPTAIIMPFTDSQLHALYHNVELEKNIEFVDHFLETQRHIDKFQLVDLLTNYHRVRANLIAVRSQYNQAIDATKQLQSSLWSFSSERTEEEGECEDGNTVMAVRDSKRAEYNDSISATLGHQLKQCKELLADNYSLYSFRAEVCKVKVEDFLSGVIARYNQEETDNQHSPVYTSQEELKLSISVLFRFLRKDLRDERLLQDLRQWTEMMTAVLLAHATLYDHLFLLNHILRCPAGVGKWAAGFIQPAVPRTDPEETSFDNPFLDHMITILATILLPVKHRQNYLQEFKLNRHHGKSDEKQEEKDKVWVVLDSEGSEDEESDESWSQLRESDLVSLLNQVPVDHMFRYVLRVEEHDETDHYDISLSSQYSLLKLFAFSTQFVYLLREGLRTFNTPKYRQLAKRLGRLVRHTVHYVSDHWENFKLANWETIDPAMSLRLQVEYDNFFMRATKCIFSSQKLGTWQFLAVIPFGTISMEMLWRIFYTLHLDYRDEHHGDFGADIEDWTAILSSPDLQLQFEEKCAEAGETEVYFLLSAFANMAMSRTKEDIIFIERATLDLFDVGFVCESTRDLCSKNCRDLLSNVCHEHPFLISTLLRVLSDRVQHIGKLSNYLFRELPFLLWRPTKEDMKLVTEWLHRPAASLENLLARTVLTNLDWGEGGLNPQLHVSTARAIVEAVGSLIPDLGQISAGYGIVSTSMVTMTNLVRQTPEQVFTEWGWEMLSRLHLHTMDRSPGEARGMISGDRDVISRVMDFDLSREIERVVAGAVARQPLASYCCLVLTQVGHVLPEVVERGLDMVTCVQSAGRLDHVIELLLYIVPLFLVDQMSVSDPTLVNIVANLLAADQTYFSLAKNMVSGSFPGPVTKEFGNMLEKSISNWTIYGHKGSEKIVSLWLRLLTSVSSWNSNVNVMFLVDILCRHSFFNDIAYKETLESFQSSHSDLISKSDTRGLLSWVSGSRTPCSLLPSSVPSYPWLAYFVLQSEHVWFINSGLCRHLVEELAHNKPLEEALVTAAKKAEVACPSSGFLPLYRWAQQALDTPPEHPAAPFFWQRFFQLFLTRPLPVHGEETRGVGMMFFTGIFNSMYYSKMKTAVHTTGESLDLAVKMMSSTETDGHSQSEETGIFCDKLTKLYRSFYMWLDEAKILDSTLYIPALSPAHDPEKLLKIFSGNESLWMEYVDPNQISLTSYSAVKDWDKLHFRIPLESKVTRNLYSSDTRNLSPAERVIKRLQSYESRVPGPSIRKNDPPVPNIQVKCLSQSNLHTTLINPLDSLSALADSFSNNYRAYGSLNCNYMELAPNLWKEDDVEVVVKAPCGGTVGPKKEKIGCAGAAHVTLNYCEAKKQEGVAVRLENNRKEWKDIEGRLLAAPPKKQIVAAAVIDNITHKVLKLYEKDLGKGVTSSNYHVLALEIFYQVSGSVSEDWLGCPPLRHFVAECLETLGTVVVSGAPGQSPKLLDTLVKGPHLSPFLSTHFTPNIHNTREMVDIYGKIIDLPEGDGALPFVLLSKFDIDGWLKLKPAVEDRSEIISFIGKALYKTGHDPEQEREMIHGIHRRHLDQLVKVDWPVHYQEVLLLLLKLSADNQLDPAVWYDLINSITDNACRFRTEQSAEDRVNALRQFVISENKLSIDDIVTSSRTLAAHFTKERLLFGLYGLYPKYRSYVDPMASYLCLQGHLLVAAVKTDSEQLDIWQSLEDVFTPWLLPLEQSERHNTSSWIQQLAEDGAPLLPWIPGDTVPASTMMAAFVSCVTYLQEKCHPVSRTGGKTALVRLWILYATKLAQPGVKDHILAVVHPALSALKWSMMVPGETEVDLMVKLSSMFLPPCHAFLGALFVQISWQELLENATSAQCDRLIPALLILLVKLSGEPSVRQGGKILAVIIEAESWSFGSVDAKTYEALVQWFIMSMDCRCLIKHPDRNPVDAAVLRLLQSAAGHTDAPGRFHPQTGRKRQVWVKCCIKLLTSTGSKHKNFLSANQPALHTAIRKVIEDIDIVATCDATDALNLVKELLVIFNSSSASVLPGSALSVTQSWLSHNNGTSPLLLAILKQAGSTVTADKLLPQLVESTLEAFFRESIDDFTPSWETVRHALSWPNASKMKVLLDQAVSKGNCLFLFSYINHKMPTCISIQEEQVLSSSLLDWLRFMSLEPTLGSEAKLALLYRQLIVLLQRQAKYSADQGWVVGALIQLTDILAAIADSSPGWSRNLLGAIGLGSSQAISHRGKFLARALFIYIRSLVTVDKSTLVERCLVEEKNEGKGAVLRLPEMKQHLEKLSSLKNNKAFLGLHELIDWVIVQVSDESNILEDSHNFIDYLTINKLYIELYMKV